MLTALIAIDVSGGRVLVRLKSAVCARPETAAVTAYVPEVPFAVNAGEVALPELSVTTVALVWPANEPLAPDAGALNVTLTPGTAAPVASLTTATSGPAKAVFTAALCGVPLTGVIAAGGLPITLSVT